MSSSPKRAPFFAKPPPRLAFGFSTFVSVTFAGFFYIFGMLGIPPKGFFFWVGGKMGLFADFSVFKGNLGRGFWSFSLIWALRAASWAFYFANSSACWILFCYSSFCSLNFYSIALFSSNCFLALYSSSCLSLSASILCNFYCSSFWAFICSCFCLSCSICFLFIYSSICCFFFIYSSSCFCFISSSLFAISSSYFLFFYSSFSFYIASASCFFASDGFVSFMPGGNNGMPCPPMLITLSFILFTLWTEDLANYSSSFTYLVYIFSVYFSFMMLAIGTYFTTSSLSSNKFAAFFSFKVGLFFFLLVERPT